MKKISKVAMLIVLGLGSAVGARAQTVYNGDLLVGFTKTSGNDLVYDLGPASALTNGKTWNLSSSLTGFTLATVNWGVIGTSQPPITRTGGPYTSWTTTVVGAPVPQTISSYTSLKNVEGAVANIYQNFPAAGMGQSLSIAASDPNGWDLQTLNPTATGAYANTFGGFPNVTGTTADSFYKVVDDSSAPILLGSFSLSSSGVLTYTAASVGPTAPQIIKTSRSGNISTIFFTTVSGSYTYTLYYTNSAGLTAPVATWPASPTTLVGNGLTNSLTDSTTDSNRFYRVSAH